MLRLDEQSHKHVSRTVSPHTQNKEVTDGRVTDRGFNLWGWRRRLKGGHAVLSIAGESLLQKDREDWETKRRAQTEKFAIDREQRLNEHTAARDTTAFERQRQLAGEEQAAHLQRKQGLLTQKQDFERKKQTEELQAKDASLDKSHRFELMKQQADMGRDLVLHSMRLQDARQSASPKLDPRVQARIEFQMTKLKGLQDRLKEGLLDPDQLTTSKEEVEQIGMTIDQLLGVEDPRSTTKSIIDPDSIVDRFRRTRRPTSSNPYEAQRSQPR